ncbi:ADP-ribosyl cyclase/cyclic ADP-ribose hydrolase 2-like isoform X2 [Anguilla anguilla]|uniref:ADP-ribosyl cyclase/cyclic ADP-ribose hydrolase 2-like isoform X2 n=1 Tax=Anguilla anguilla TaxID=7936 RepID=UPI0015A8F518|nr:ADP-ribosyl cyclase/cyclic ADP-ribose hydrolase 2-like isoform X2 [Anguilla anguilla]
MRCCSSVLRPTLCILANWIFFVTSGVSQKSELSCHFGMMSGGLAVCLLPLLVFPQSVVPQEKALWQGEGTTADLQEVILGRCYNYIRVVNPSVGEKNCTAIWNAFRDAFIYRDPCSVTDRDYQTFISLSLHSIPPNKALFWEKNKQLVHSYSDTGRRMMPLGETLIGWLGDDLTWCGNSSGEGLDSVSCPTTAECENNPVESFWRIASSTYANLSSGVIQVMLNGSVSDGTFPENSFFANYELPYLRKDKVSKVQIWIMDDIEGPDVESCGTKSVAVLQQILEQKGFEYTCADNYRPVRILQCVDSPSHPACLCSSSASTPNLSPHHLVILLFFTFQWTAVD